MHKKHKNKFANRVIALCLIMGVITTLFTLLQCYILHEPVTASLFAEIRWMWFGELLLLGLRQVLGSDIVKQAKGENSNSGGSI